MRSLSETEKKLIKSIIELDGEDDSQIYLGNVFDKFYNEISSQSHSFVKLIAEDDVAIMVKSKLISGRDPFQPLEHAQRIRTLLLTTAKLMEFLEFNGYAYFLGEEDLSILGDKWRDENYTKVDILESEIKKLVFKYAKRRIYISEDLRQLYNNGFKTREESMHEEEIEIVRKQLRNTWIALIITAIGLLISIISPLVTTEKVEIISNTQTQEQNALIVETQNDLEAMENRVNQLVEHYKRRMTQDDI